MLKKLAVILIVLVVCAPSLYAQTSEESEDIPQETAEKPKLGFTMNFLIGLSSYENIYGEQVSFQKFSLFPEFSYGKWGLGLDFTFEFDGNWELRDLDDNDPGTRAHYGGVQQHPVLPAGGTARPEPGHRRERLQLPICGDGIGCG
ncbi:MAG: hypothetical protein AMS17_14900 [Spirochaetes bacterium DG_61]|nr:MAG: hypothetical protein AMS17_14900 [Spirochaetes bacterium DG_61]